MDSKLLQPDSELRIVLLGKTGVGKSVSGNTILGSNEFKSEPSPSSVTVKCEKKTREFDGQTLSIVDTPGLFHTSKNHEEVIKQIQDCTIWLTPGPHVFLLVMKPGAFSRQDKKMLEAFQKVFPHATKHTIVLFTCADKDQVKAFIENNKYLKKFIESCEAYHVFKNKDKQTKDECQVTGLLQKMSKIKKERGHYSNELFKEALKALEQIMPQKKSASEVDEKRARISKVLHEIVDYSKIAEMLGVDVSTAKTAWKYVDSYREFVIKWVYDHMPPE